MIGAQYWDSKLGTYKDCEVIERNGQLVYVEDVESGACDWVADFDVIDEDE
jgi:hypothetical protein